MGVSGELPTDPGVSKDEYSEAPKLTGATELTTTTATDVVITTEHQPEQPVVQEQPQVPRTESARTRSRGASTTSDVVVMKGEAHTLATRPADACLEMVSDILCVRTMSVSFTDADGEVVNCSRSGYNVKIFLPQGCTDIVVSFEIVGGGRIYKVNREVEHMPWVRDEQGQLVPETFRYPTPPAARVLYAIKGPSFGSFVYDVDECGREECLFELVSRDWSTPRTMHIIYKDKDGNQQQKDETGYNLKCHLPFDSKDIEVTFSTMGGVPIKRVNRREPHLPWVIDGNDEHPAERFVYSKCPLCVRYEVRGGALQSYISRVDQQVFVEDDEHEELPSCFDAPELFSVPAEKAPPIGGLVGMKAPHSPFLLPAQVVLYEPPQNEIVVMGTRNIFLNTPLSEIEHDSLRDFHKVVAASDIGDNHGNFPHSVETHALRLLQKSKFDPHKGLELMKLAMKERNVRLPIAESDVLEDLRSGGFYWHGRDKSCRPCMVVRVERLAHLVKDKERTLRVVVFMLEYALRFAMVPGRVENWVVIIDCQNATSVVSAAYLVSTFATANAIGVMLEKVYCGRMGWIRIVNIPGATYLNRMINSLIPADKKHKVKFPTHVADDLRELFEPNQLEVRYGGTAPDLVPSDVYPFKFFPNCRGVVDQRDGPAAIQILQRGETHEMDDEDLSLHSCTNLLYHQGALWDESSEEIKNRWVPDALNSCLTPENALYLGKFMADGKQPEPCRNLDMWTEIVLPAATRGRVSIGGVEVTTTKLGPRRIHRTTSETIPQVPARRGPAKDVESQYSATVLSI